MSFRFTYRYNKSDRSHVVLWAKELSVIVVFLRPLGLRLLKNNSTIESHAYIAAEFVVMNHKNLGPGSICLFASRTGTTPETVNAAKFCKAAGATTVGLVAKLGTPLAEICDYVFDNFAEDDILGESLHIQFLPFILRLMYNKGEFPKYDEFMGQLDKLTDELLKVKEQVEPVAKAWAEKHKDTDYHMVIASGNLWGEAYNYAMCILEEMQWLKTKSIHSAEFFHGTLELLEKDTSILLFKSECETRPLDERVEKFAVKISEDVNSIDLASFELPSISKEFRVLLNPVVLITALERYSCHIEHVRDHNLNIRRYYHQMDY